MSKIVISGGSGFVGSHVADVAIEQGHKVTVFDRYRPTDINPKVNFYLGDLKDKDAVLDIVNKHDIIINLGGLLGTSESVVTPAPMVEVNILGALNVFDACRIYGKRGMQVGVGNYFMNNPYSISKSTAVRFALMYNKEHNTKIAIVRGLNAYGPRQHHRPVRKITPNVIIPALLNKPITIYGDGEQIMDFIYVRDFAEIILRSVTMEHDIYDRQFEAGMGEDTTINWFVNKIVEMTGSKSEINHIPMRAGETKNSVVKGDPTTLKPLNYSRKDMTEFDEGLQKTIDYYKTNLKDYPWDE